MDQNYKVQNQWEKELSTTKAVTYYLKLTLPCDSPLSSISLDRSAQNCGLLQYVEKNR